MKLRRTITALLALALASAALPADAQAAPQGAAQTLPFRIQLQPQTTATTYQIGGTLMVTATVTVNADIPDGTTLSYYAGASVYDAAYSNSHSVSGSATVGGGMATVSFAIPYIWLVSSKTDMISVNLSLRASVEADTDLGFFTSFNTSIPLPAKGATSKIAFNGSL